MGHEEVSHTQMREILQAEHGVTFFPKRDLVIPQVDYDRLHQLIREDKFEYSQYLINIIYKFLHGEAVGDGWGSDHESRIAWRRKLFQKYGPVFYEVYHAHNQLRVNKLAPAGISIRMLSRYVIDTQISQGLTTIAGEMSQLMSGYGRIESLDTKLSIVHFYEDKSIEALGIFS